jgi:hypothetical protein
MHFGDILDQWERSGAGAVSGKRNETGGAMPEPVHPMDAWLRINGVYDKDSEADAGPNAASERRRLRHKKPDAAIDIHGLTRDEAWEALDRFFSESRGNGLEKLLVIHGKGNHSAGEAVLKRMVREFIERCPFAGESGQGKAAGGGEGATWVLLKKVRQDDTEEALP